MAKKMFIWFLIICVVSYELPCSDIPTLFCCFPTNTDFWYFDFIDTDDACHSDDEGSGDESDDGLPPLERNLNHVSLEESDTESE